MTNKRSLSAFLRRNGLAILCTAALTVLMYQVVFTFRLAMADKLSDYNAHMLWAVGMSPRELFTSFYDGSIRLWHSLVYLVSRLVPNTWRAAAIVTAAVTGVTYFLLFKIWDRLLPEKFPRWLLALLSASVFLVHQLTLPGGAFYWSPTALQGSINPWHNPTHIMVRPFALAVFYMTVNIYDRRRYGQDHVLPDPEALGGRFAFTGGFWQQFRRPVFTRSELVLYPVCLLLSAYAKPSFLQFFGPALFLFLLIDVIRTKGMLLPFSIKMAVAYLPALLIVLRQFDYAFSSGVIDSSQVVETVESAVNGGPHGVQIYLFRGSVGLADILTRLRTDWLPFLLFCAFPLFLMLIDPKRGFGGAATRLGLLCAIVGRFEAVLFHETGSRAIHGNFLWGFLLASWVFWAAAIGQYAQLLPEKSRQGRLARYGGTALLLWHLIAGVTYVTIILRTANYQF